MKLLLVLFLLQAPGDGWTFAPAPTREVRRVYWELFQTTEVWVRLLPRGPHEEPPLVHLILQAFFPGPASKGPRSALPQWPRGKPQRLALRAQPLPLTVIRELSLRLEIDGDTVDLTGEGRKYTHLGCPAGAVDCAPNGIAAELEPSLLLALAGARGIRGQVLGFPIELEEPDLLALREFADRIGWSGRKVAR